MSYLLEMKGIVKAFGGVHALNGIDIHVRPGECVGLCGENGAGKSTLMKVLSGVYPHGTWDGEIIFDGKPLIARNVRDSEAAGIVIIHQELMLVPALSVAENIFLGHELTLPGGRMNYPAMYQRSEELLARLGLTGIDVTAPVVAYAGGQQQLIEIAKALNKQARLLILDEPSSSLSASEITVLLGIVRGLKEQGVACVYISHKLDEVAAVCDTITVIRDGQHIATTPMQEMDTNRIISQMVGREMNQLYPRQPHDIGEVVFEARNVTADDPSRPGFKRVDNVSFKLRRGEILGFSGLVGAGRTELMSALFGVYEGKYSAECWLEGKQIKIGNPRDALKAGIALVPEDRKRHGIVPDLDVGQNITLTVLGRFSRFTWLHREAELDTVTAQISKMTLKTASPALPIGSLSGGNQQKAVLAKMLLTEPRVLIVDEPTRGVDVGAKYEIYKLMFALAQQGVAIIMVSSDMAEVLGVSDRILVMGEGQLRGDFINDGLTQETLLAAALGQAAQANESTV